VIWISADVFDLNNQYRKSSKLRCTDTAHESIDAAGVCEKVEDVEAVWEKGGLGVDLRAHS